MGIETAIIGAAVLGAAGSAYKVNEQKKQARKQKLRLERQERQARVEARNQASLSQREETGAEVNLGREEETASGNIARAGAGAGTSRKGSVKGRVGGLNTTMPKKKASSRIGL